MLACSADDANVPCRDGFDRADDGHCYPPLSDDAPSFEDVLSSMPYCALLPAGNGLIDLELGCASGVCVGMDYFETNAVLHTEGDCTVASWSDQSQYCTWDIGLQGLFTDEDVDGIPDEGAGNERVRVYSPYAGATEHGLGAGINPRCYVDTLGQPSEVLLVDIGGVLYIEDLIYDDYGLSTYDWGTDDDSDRPNGVIDNVYLYGAPER